jgi:DNA-binding transcriptional MocR family regulator
MMMTLIMMMMMQVFVLNGALLSLDILSYLLADEGDVFLCPVPGYNGYFQAGVQRWGIHMASVPLLTLDVKGIYIIV